MVVSSSQPWMKKEIIEGRFQSIVWGGCLSHRAGANLRGWVFVRTGCVNEGGVLITVADMRILDVAYSHSWTWKARACACWGCNRNTHTRTLAFTHTQKKENCNHLARVIRSCARRRNKPAASSRAMMTTDAHSITSKMLFPERSISQFLISTSLSTTWTNPHR